MSKLIPRKPAKPRNRRLGRTTLPEQDLVAALVLDQPQPMTEQQIGNLSRVLRRSKEAIRDMVDHARENFVTRAERYVDVHAEATEAALKAGDPKSLEVATRSSQWALEHISADGARIVEKSATQGSGVKILIGVKIGGMNAPTLE